MSDVLQRFSAPVREWFRTTLGEPTPPQVAGWPAIQRGENTLILAPTGSGKTMAAFLWGIEELWRVERGAASSELADDEGIRRGTGKRKRTRDESSQGIRIVYISPLKALNNDIQRNLRVPLAGIRKQAQEMGVDFPDISVLVRSGDTSQRERQAMLKHPPHILITTPESLYLMLTSERARQLFQTVRTVIVDEIHTLAGDKRGVHLALSLERLQHLATQPVQRIGLSATIRPLDEVARFLGGNEWVAGPSGERISQPRSVTIVDAGYKKPLDLQVETVVDDFRTLPGGSVWPAIIPRVLELIRQHRTTLIFANNRRQAERTADRLNEQIAAEATGQTSGLIRDGVAVGSGFMAVGAGTSGSAIRAHHGSMSREARLEMEQQLKAGELPALVGTSSLELGIDIGAVDLVVQLQSPKSVAQGLQRVGRSGHLVGQTSKGRIFPTHREDIMEAAAIAGGMLRGEVEPIATPRNPLDVLAQQIVAMVAVETWEVDALFDLLRCAYAYQDLTPRVFQAVLEMLAGRFPSQAHQELRPRLSWDHVNNRLASLPGSQLTAITNGGTIADRGAFGAYLGNGKTKLGELDEEFVYETRVGDAFMLGSQVWRVIEITDDKVQVVEAPGATPRMPFWRGDFPWRPYELGKRVGEFRRAVAERLLALEELGGTTKKLAYVMLRSAEASPVSVAVKRALGPYGTAYELPHRDASADLSMTQRESTAKAHSAATARKTQEDLEDADAVVPGLSKLVDQWRAALDDPAHPDDSPSGLRVTIDGLLAWLKDDYALDDSSAWHVLSYVASQLDSVGAISSDRSVIVEVFDDVLGDPRMVVHSCFGGRVNGPWGLALASALRERTGVEVEVQSNDDGILLRFPASDADFPLDIVTEMTPSEVNERILAELPDSAAFGARFRQNAARALLLPTLRGGKRTPFWLQRLRARDLLQIVRKMQDFPIVAETYRDVLQDVLDVPHLHEVLTGIQTGDIEVVAVESEAPSPVAQSLLWDFTSIYLYEWDAPKAERQLQTLATQRDLLQDLLKDIALDELLRPEAVAEIRSHLQHTAPTAQARTAEELAVLLQQMGDLSPSEIAVVCVSDPSGWVGRLAGERRIVLHAIPTAHGLEERWIAAEYAEDYSRAFLPTLRTLPTFSTLPTLPDHLTNLPVYPSTDAARPILERYLRHAGPVTVEAIQARYAFPMDWLEVELDRLIADRELAEGRFTPPTHHSSLTTHHSEYLDRRALEQIHRRTLSILRQEVQPASFAVYADFLARWQHVHPTERLDGPGALTQALQQLRALPAPGPVWERDVLPLRLARYDPQETAALCQSGELIWIGSGEADARRARIRFIFRGEGSAFVAPAPDDLSNLSREAKAVVGFLQSEGAVFFADIAGALELSNEATETALVELILAGLVTGDSLESMRNLVRRGSPTPTSGGSDQRPYSALEADLAQRLGKRGRPTGVRGRPSQSELRAARQRVRKRLEAAPAAAWAGRWTLVHRFGILGKPLPADERIARQARQLLARHGVVTRTSLEAEDSSWAWEPIYRHLQRMEMRGEVRRGYFVQGLPGVQFALPEVVERLRAVRAIGEDVSIVVLNACDPANLYGAALGGGPRVREGLTADGEALTFARIPSTWLVQQRGLPVLLAEDTGSRITTAQGVAEAVVQAALQTLVQHLATFERRLIVHAWNGAPVLESPGQPLLEAVGFYREYPGMAWERPANAALRQR